LVQQGGRPHSVGSDSTLPKRTAEADQAKDSVSNGSRGGDGVVATDCGERAVSVNELDGELWVQWGDQRSSIMPAVIDEIVRCDDGPGEDDD